MRVVGVWFMGVNWIRLQKKQVQASLLQVNHVFPFLSDAESFYRDVLMKPYDLSVTVTPQYLPEQSEPGEQQFVFAYTVRITNNGQNPAQVISRHWIITDGQQNIQEVRGLGVVGQQPLLSPGETFEYTSGCPLPTPIGTMRGTYHCVGDNGIPFEVPIDEFVLAMPRTLH
jgi:ApaG protein